MFAEIFLGLFGLFLTGLSVAAVFFRNKVLEFADVKSEGEEELQKYEDEIISHFETQLIYSTFLAYTKVSWF